MGGVQERGGVVTIFGSQLDYSSVRSDRAAIEVVRMSRVVKKRRKKMRKHKHRKMLKRTRHQRRK